MILDDLDRLDRYRTLSPLIGDALAWLRANENAPDGRFPIVGDDLYVMPQSYTTAPASEKRFEAHRKYVDIQLVTQGSEIIDYAHVDSLEVTQRYDDARDVMFLDGAGSPVRVDAGQWMLLMPHDAHRPGVMAGSPAPVRKVVFKLALSSFGG